ncbi:MAG: TAXI family TRAP transporter solute-binding subunit [Gemmatimonas sp.]
MSVERIRAPAIRSRLVLEVAAELVTADQPLKQTRVLLSDHGHGWPVRLDSASTLDAIDAVVLGESTMAMVNPSAMLTLAYRGKGPFAQPQPVRTVCVLPSPDVFVCAATADSGLASFEDIGAKRFPLKVSMRAQREHPLHMVFDHMMEASGFSRDQLLSWGGEVRYDGGPRIPKTEAIVRGANAVCDEAIRSWLAPAIHSGMRVLSLSEPAAQRMEAMGYRRSILPKKTYPELPSDVIAVDFSGWAVFVREDAPDALVSQICAALEARRHLIPWDGDGPLPLERMCCDTPEAPMGVPLHAAAERFWRERGYIR